MEGFRGATGARAKGEGGDLVTEYDERCEALLRDRLGALLPEAAFVGEESGGSAAGLAWHVDPIDGTGNYAHGHPWFCLSIGLWSDEGPVAGVIHAPAMGLTYAAARGRGARRNGQAIAVSETAGLDAALLATGFPHDRATNPDNNYAAFVALDARSHGVRRCAAAALELAIVADGGYDGFWDRGLSSWDVAAAVCLIEESGGRVTHLSGAPFALAAKVDILASNGRLHDPLKDALSHVRALPPHDGVQ
ncbi:MAG: inositol monophosphatase [Sandaracinaceae bacterium]|nr:inositol monophosphatase [Sandaracinaceae bacterium]